MNACRTRRLFQRRGTILPLAAISTVALCGMLALSIDLGRLAVGRAQAQDAADAAAFAGARTLSTGAASNLTQASANAIAMAIQNTVVGTTILESEVSVRLGSYHYTYGTQVFTPMFPPPSGDNYNLAEVTIQHPISSTFANVLGISQMTIRAKSTAAHRPRDVAMVVDFSGSMNNESDLWNCESYLGSYLNTPNNVDPIFPQWGPYAPSFSPLATLQCTSSSSMVGKCNVTTSIQGFPAIVTNLFQNARGQSAVGAFSTAPASVTVTKPAGDQYLNKKSTTTTARTWQDITGSSTTAFTGYAAQQSGKFYGYQEGPGYWGKTFFLWPPDPTATNDWRKLISRTRTARSATAIWNCGAAPGPGTARPGITSSTTKRSSTGSSTSGPTPSHRNFVEGTSSTTPRFQPTCRQARTLGATSIPQSRTMTNGSGRNTSTS
jgi:Flp pilus assembly protein TadG